MASREVFHFDEFTLEPARTSMVMPYATPIMWLRRPEEMTHRPRATVAAKSFAANFESIPWQALLTPTLTRLVGLIRQLQTRETALVPAS